MLSILKILMSQLKMLYFKIFCLKRFCNSLNDEEEIIEYPREDLFVVKNSLSKSLCKKIIINFNCDSQLYDGIVGSGYKPDVKLTKDLLISKLPEWEILDDILKAQLTKHLKTYLQYLSENKIYIHNDLSLNDTGYQIQRYNKNEGFYDWHHDFSIIDENGIIKHRLFTFIWYLNDVNEGGETSITKKVLIKPESGKFLLFPSFVTYLHKGNVPISDDKYIITGWLYIEHPTISNH